MTDPTKIGAKVIQMAMKRLSGDLTKRKIEMYLTECITSKSPYELEAIRVKQLSMAPTKLDDLKAKVQDDLRKDTYPSSNHHDE